MYKSALNQLDPVAYGVTGAAGGIASSGLNHLANLLDYKSRTNEVRNLLDYMDNMKADNPKMSTEEIFHKAPGKSEWLENALRGETRGHVQELLDRTLRHKPAIPLLRLGRNTAIAGAGGAGAALLANRFKAALDAIKDSLAVSTETTDPKMELPKVVERDTPFDTLKKLFSSND